MCSSIFARACRQFAGTAALSSFVLIGLGLACEPAAAAPSTTSPSPVASVASTLPGEVPQAVKETLARESGGGKLLSIEQEEEDEEAATYEAEVVIGPHHYKIEIAEDGTLLEKEIIEQEEDVSMEDLPAAVQATLKREAAGATPKEIEKHAMPGRSVYEAEATIGAGTYKLLVAEDGTLLVKKLERRRESDEEDEEHERAESGGREGDEHAEHGEEEEEGEEGEEHGERERTTGEQGHGAMVWSFGDARPGSVPSGWKIAETSGTGTPAVWQVVRDPSAPSPPNMVAITKNGNYGHTFNLLMANGTGYRDLTIRVKVKAMAGREDQGGGPIWRAKDGDNYYISRWNPLENNFRVYYVKNGRRRQLASSNIDADTSVWHTIEISHRGSSISASFDGKKMMEVRDETFPGAGMVGLWVKADGRTAFDDLTVSSLSTGEAKRDADRPR